METLETQQSWRNNNKIMKRKHGTDFIFAYIEANSNLVASFLANCNINANIVAKSNVSAQI